MIDRRRNMNPYVMAFHEIDHKWRTAVGGKGVNLGELTTISGIQVPEGFCVTTKAFKESFESNADYQTLLQELRLLKADDRRSEEHTSELQSRGHLVCRLLLEKKKQKQKSKNNNTQSNNKDTATK